MPRAIRCNLPNQPYECSTRTVNEQFLLNPFAAPGRLSEKYDNVRFGDAERLRRDACIAENNAKRLSDLIGQIKAWRTGQADEPYLTADTLPETVNNIVGTWLAKAIEHTKVEYYGLIVLSDHPHHYLGHKEGKLDEFFQYFDGQVARALNRFHGRHHQFWSRRYSAIPVLDEQSDIERLIYFLTNPQKADLVDKIEQWPGLSSAQFYLGETEENNEFLFFDRTAWYRAKKPQAIARFLQVIKIKYAVLPALAHLAEEERKELLRRLVGEREAGIRDNRQSEGTRVLGEEGLKQTDTRSRPQKPKTGRMPLCICSDQELRMAFITARYRYMAVYRELTKDYRESEQPGILELPLGAYPPPKLLRFRHPADPDRSPLPNLTVR
jgi:hypothetical protein